MSESQQPEAMQEHYFTSSPTTPSRPATVRLDLPDLSCELETDRGVFSPDRIDAGTKLLLQEAPPPPPSSRHLLDLGCGYGPIAVALASRAPQATVWAVDTNERAIALCARNAERIGLTSVQVRPAHNDNPVANIPTTVTFDAIYANPPIRVGKATLHSVLQHALLRLTPGGTAYLVVHKHLGSDSLQRWLGTAGFPTRRLISRVGYRILAISSGSRSVLD
ncbi:MAG: class I SAM-dependent methyltransferase [Acidimicrobiales bacterium]|nr:class I SAM-dependent methyltransferase [Acidimicrobiales bacterium]